MRPPLDVPSAPSRSSTHSTTMPRSTMASVRGCLGAGIARGFARHRQRVAVSLLDVLSRDSQCRRAASFCGVGQILSGDGTVT